MDNAAGGATARQSPLAVWVYVSGENQRKLGLELVVSLGKQTRAFTLYKEKTLTLWVCWEAMEVKD